MSAQSSIEWTDATWNPVRGCTRVSEGCRNCYAEVMAARFSAPGQWGHGFATMKGGDHRWTGKVALIEDQLTLPLRWKKPRRIFVNSTSDLFHESLPDEAIDRVFAVMALAPQHTFQVLTKRPERMREYLRDWQKPDRSEIIRAASGRLNWFIDSPGDLPHMGILWEGKGWPLPNVWLGTSVEDQATADERIPHLLDTPAAIRFVSYEPALGPVDFTRIDAAEANYYPLTGWRAADDQAIAQWARLDWIIMGGESGKGARPMHPGWARSVRDQCAAAGVPFFFKQWGEWMPHGGAGVMTVIGSGNDPSVAWPDGTIAAGGNAEDHGGNGTLIHRVGKKRAGRLLDGREHNEFPDSSILHGVAA